jgi:signal transduction histidine kinase
MIPSVARGKIIAQPQNHKGTGRSLYFVRNVIETHGGMVGYEPTHEGNNFYFVLPLITGPEPPLAVELAASA